jgi:hypothetical protein
VPVTIAIVNRIPATNVHTIVSNGDSIILFLSIIVPSKRAILLIARLSLVDYFFGTITVTTAATIRAGATGNPANVDMAPKIREHRPKTKIFVNMRFLSFQDKLD